MTGFPRPASTALSLLIACAVAAATGSAASTWASEEDPTPQDVEQARRCAAETRVAGHAFNEVRDSVRAGGTTRAVALLSVAEDSLLAARSACRNNPEVSSQLEILSGEVEGLRRALATAR